MTNNLLVGQLRRAKLALCLHVDLLLVSVKMLRDLWVSEQQECLS